MENQVYDQICLASQSPRRRELLAQIGVKFTVYPADIDESVKDNESSEIYIQRITLAKARFALEQLSNEQRIAVLASDTAVIIDNKILGKPKSKVEWREMLESLSGKRHRVLTGVVLMTNQNTDYLLNESEVSFCELTTSDIDAYLETDEGMDKAGGYGIQGYAAGFIQTISGSFSGIMGLPLYETRQLLLKHHVKFPLGRSLNRHELEESKL